MERAENKSRLTGFHPASPGASWKPLRTPKVPPVPPASAQPPPGPDAGLLSASCGPTTAPNGPGPSGTALLSLLVSLTREITSLLLFPGIHPRPAAWRGSGRAPCPMSQASVRIREARPAVTRPSRALTQKPLLFLPHFIFFKLPEGGEQVPLDPHQNQRRHFAAGRRDSIGPVGSEDQGRSAAETRSPLRWGQDGGVGLTPPLVLAHKETTASPESDRALPGRRGGLSPLDPVVLNWA